MTETLTTNDQARYVIAEFPCGTQALEVHMVRRGRGSERHFQVVQVTPENTVAPVLVLARFPTAITALEDAAERAGWAHA